MIARLYCSFRRNSHAPCLHPVIHLELPFPSLHCFPDSSVSCAPKPPSLRACSKSPRSHSVFISSGDDDYFRNFILFIRSKGCIAFLDHRWSGQDFGIFFFFLTLIISLTFHLPLCSCIEQPKKLLRACTPLKSKQTHL